MAKTKTVNIREEIDIPHELKHIDPKYIVHYINKHRINTNDVYVLSKNNKIHIVRSKFKKNIILNTCGTCWLISLLSIVYNSDIIEQLDNNISTNKNFKNLISNDNDKLTNDYFILIPHNKTNELKELLKNFYKNKLDTCTYGRTYNEQWISSQNYNNSTCNQQEIINCIYDLFKIDCANGLGIGNDYLLFFLMNILCKFYFNIRVNMSIVSIKDEDIKSKFKDSSFIGCLLKSHNINDGHMTAIYSKDNEQYFFNNGVIRKFNFTDFFSSYNTNSDYVVLDTSYRYKNDSQALYPFLFDLDSNNDQILKTCIFFHKSELSDSKFIYNNTTYYLDMYFMSDDIEFDFSLLNFNKDIINHYLTNYYIKILPNKINENDILKIIKLSSYYNSDMYMIKFSSIDQDKILQLFKKIYDSAKKSKKNMISLFLYDNSIKIIDLINDILSSELIIDKYKIVKYITKLLVLYSDLKYNKYIMENYIESNVICIIFSIYCEIDDHSMDKLFLNGFFLEIMRSNKTFIKTNEFKNFMDFLSDDKFNRYPKIVSFKTIVNNYVKFINM